MIELTIRIEEIAERKFNVQSKGCGHATEGEFELGEKIREAINQVMRRELAEAENGLEVVRNGKNHGKPVQGE